MNKEVFLKAILAGIFIGIGGTAYLMVDTKIIGALLFSVGLFAICTMKFNLFTGKVCYALNNGFDYNINLILIWVGNLIGTFLVGFLESFTSLDIQQKAIKLCEAKLDQSLLSAFILAFFCNILIYLAVEGFSSNKDSLGKYLSILFGVVVFIMCGFEHCVANMYYFSVAGMWSIQTIMCILIMTIGNALGGLFIPFILKVVSK